MTEYTACLRRRPNSWTRGSGRMASARSDVLRFRRCRGTDASRGVRECDYLISDLVARTITYSTTSMPSVFSEPILVWQIHFQLEFDPFGHLISTELPNVLRRDRLKRLSQNPQGRTSILLSLHPLATPISDYLTLNANDTVQRQGWS
jgi:hypothetical protein